MTAQVKKNGTKIIFFGTSDFAVVQLATLVKHFNVVAVVTAPDKPAGRKQMLTSPPVKMFAKRNEYGAPRSRAARYLHFTEHSANEYTTSLLYQVSKNSTMKTYINNLSARFIVCAPFIRAASSAVFWANNKIPVFQPEKLDSNFRFQISSFKPDIFVVAAYGKMIPKEILDIPRFGALNVHPSLLPRWRGPSPMQYVILNGDRETGVTVMLVDEQMDHGPILAQVRFQIPDFRFTYAELHDALATLGAKLLVETLPKWIAGNIKPIPQDESKVTYSKLLKKEDGCIDWNTSAEKINRKIRALNPWPGTFAVWKRKQTMLRLHIEHAEILDEKLSGSKRIGEVFLNNDALCVKTRNGILRLLQLQLESKKSLDAKTFLNGYADIVGSVLS